MILAGDIGATNTRLALFSRERGLKESVTEEIYASKDFYSLEEALDVFKKKVPKAEINAAAFVAAGPKIDDGIHVTNLNWSTIDKSSLSSFLGNIPVALHNDLIGICNLIPVLEAEHLEVLNQVPPAINSPIGVIAPGSGLGEGYLVWDGKEYIRCDSAELLGTV